MNHRVTLPTRKQLDSALVLVRRASWADGMEGMRKFGPELKSALEKINGLLDALYVDATRVDTVTRPGVDPALTRPAAEPARMGDIAAQVVEQIAGDDQSSALDAIDSMFLAQWGHVLDVSPNWAKTGTICPRDSEKLKRDIRGLVIAVAKQATCPEPASRPGVDPHELLREIAAVIA